MAEKEEGNKGDAPTKEDLDHLRSQLDTKLAAANKRAADAEGRASSAEAQVVGSKFNVNLPESEEGLSDEQRTSIKGALQEGEDAQKNLATLVPRYLEQQAKALAFEVAVKSSAVDDVEDIRSRLSAIKTPTEMESLAKEIELEYREAKLAEKSTSKKGKDENPDDPDDTSKRQFDEGGGSGSANKVSAVEKKIDEISIDSGSSVEDLKNAQKDLDSVYEDATKAR